MRALVVLPDRNSGSRSDWSGAFRPEARAFARYHAVPAEDVVEVDVGGPDPEDAANLLAALRRKGDPPELVAFFGHGLRTSLPQFRRVTAPALAGAVGSPKVPGLKVVLYACSTAGGEPLTGDGGYADGVRDALQRGGATGCRVFGHVGPGHATKRPYVRVFEGLGLTGEGDLVHGGPGGRWVVAPASPRWRAWVRALRDTDLRYRFPVMSQAELDAALDAG